MKLNLLSLILADNHRRNDVSGRFWIKVDTSDGPNSCWPFMGARNGKNYGNFRIGPEGAISAHRLAYVLTNGTNSIGLSHILHNCDNPPCCNPSHLRIGTNLENVFDRISRNRQAKGERIPQSLLTEKIVKDIYTSDLLQREIALLYGVSTTTVSMIKNGATWLEVTRVLENPRPRTRRLGYTVTKFSDVQIEEIKSLCTSRRIGAKKIAALTGLPHAAISHLLTKMGLLPFRHIDTRRTRK